MVHVAYSRIQKRLRYFSVLIRSEFEGKMLETLTKWTRSRQTQVVSGRKEVEYFDNVMSK